MRPGWLTVACGIVAVSACGPAEPEPTSPAQPAEIECPAPIGTIRAERCADVADEFAVLKVEAALKHAGTDKAAEARIAAIRATSELATLLRSERVGACEAHNKCKLSPRALADKDARLAAGVTRLIALWSKRQLGSVEESERYTAQVLAIRKDAGLPMPPEASRSAAAAPPPEPVARAVALDRAVRGSDASLKFGGDAGKLEVTAPDGGAREAAKLPADALKLAPGKRHQIRIVGSYAPAAAPLVKPGDELGAKLRFRSLADAEIVLSMRSLEDPDGNESAATFRVKARETGAQEATLVAAPGQTGHYLAVLVRSGKVDLDEIELVRAGAPVAAARGEAASEPFVRTTCKLGRRPLAGRGAFECGASESEAITIGQPASHLTIAVRDKQQERAAVRTLSLEGGRTLDVTPGEGAELVMSLVGAGTLALTGVEVRELR